MLAGTWIVGERQWRRIKIAISITNRTNILHARSSKAPSFVTVTNMEMSKYGKPCRDALLLKPVCSIQTESSDRYEAPYRLTHVILFFHSCKHDSSIPTRSADHL